MFYLLDQLKRASQQIGKKLSQLMQITLTTTVKERAFRKISGIRGVGVILL